MSPEGQAQLARWGLPPDTAAAAGLFEIANASAAYEEMPATPAIVLPYFDPSTGLLIRFERGSNLLPYARLRWLRPAERPTHGGFGKPKAQRYLQPKASGVKAYFSPLRDNWLDVMADARIPIFFTEGEAKGLVACSNGFVTIAFGGVYSFADRNGQLLPELEAVHWQGRDVYICFDSDAAHNPDVLAAEARLVDEIGRKRGARCHIVRLPQPGDDKVGLDDYLRLWGADSFEKLAYESEHLGQLDMKVLALNNQVAWIEREGMVYDLRSKLFIKKDNFINGSQYGANTHVTVGGKDRKTVRHVSVSQTWLKHPHAQRYGEALFRPGEGATVISERGAHALNLWEGYQSEPGDVRPFFELSAYLFSRMRPEDSALPINLIAYKAQNPQVKIPLALVMVGPQGGGKSLWGDIVAQAFAPYGQVLGSNDLKSTFQGWMERSLMAVMNEAAADVMAQSMDKLKTLISDVDQQMEEKYRPQRKIKTYTFYIINANKHAVASFEADDRRMIVINTPQPNAKEFYGPIWAWKEQGGPRYLMDWLLRYNLNGWTPPQRAPMSSEKSLAYQESLTPVQMIAEEMKTAREHTIMRWLDASRAWASRAELGNNPSLAHFAMTVRQTIDSIHIRPWYTPAELAMLFPMIVEQAMGSKHNRTTPAGAISRELRDAGIPYLISVNDPRGFWHQNRLQQYLIVADFQEWDRPITQSDFERLMKQWPTYAQLVSRRTMR